MVGFMEKRIKLVDGIEVADHLTLKFRCYPGFILVSASSLQNVEESGETQDQRNGSMTRTWPNFTGFEDEEIGPETRNVGCL